MSIMLSDQANFASTIPQPMFLATEKKLLCKPGYFVNCCREITQMGVPPGNRPADRGIGSEAHLNGTSQDPTPEDARKDGHIRGRSKLFMKYPG